MGVLTNGAQREHDKHQRDDDISTAYLLDDLHHDDKKDDEGDQAYERVAGVDDKGKLFVIWHVFESYPFDCVV